MSHKVFFFFFSFTYTLSQIHFSNTTGAPNYFWLPSRVSASDDKATSIWLAADVTFPLCLKQQQQQQQHWGSTVPHWNSGCDDKVAEVLL